MHKNKNVVLTGLVPNSSFSFVNLDDMCEILGFLARKTGNLELAECFFRLSIEHSISQVDRNGLLKSLPPGKPSSLYNGILEFLEREKWNCHEDREAQTVTMPIKGHNGSWIGVAHAREDVGVFLFFSLFPELLVSEDRCDSVAEFITRANQVVSVGNFDFSYIEGRLRFKTCVDLSGEGWSWRLIRNTVKNNIQAVDVFLPSIRCVVAGETDPETAFSTVYEKNRPAQR